MSPLIPLETSSNTVLTEGEIEEFEEFYRRIGWWRGPFATPEARKSVREFWVDRSPRAVTWLVERIAKETHGDVLDGVANLLADIGPASIEPIIEKMEGEPTRDQAEVLLKALGWIEAPQDAAAIRPQILEKTLEKYLSHPDPDIRAAACAATRVLPRDRAFTVLSQRRAIESDRYALEAIDEALGNSN